MNTKPFAASPHLRSIRSARAQNLNVNQNSSVLVTF